MKLINFLKVLSIVLLLFSFKHIHAQRIYVSKSGSDANPGTITKPFKTINKASSVAKPGNTIVIGGGTYEETIKPNRSGTAGSPIIYTSKQGEKVIISAMQALSGWRKDKGAIYKVKVNWDLGQENFIMNGSTEMDLARWPNNTDGKPFTLNSLRNDGGSNKNIVNGAYLTSSKIPGINWKGGSVFFYGDKPGAGWIAWKAFITSSFSGRVNFKLDKSPSWIRTFHAPADKGDFYLEGVKGALDYQNEWWFDSATKELFVQLPGGAAPKNGLVQMRKRKIAIDLNNRSYIHITNLAVFGGAIELKKNANNNKLYGVSSFYGNHTQGVFKGFNAGAPSVEVNGRNNSIEKCEIAFNAATGIRLGGNLNVLKNNYIHDFNYLGSYDAPLVARGGTDNKIIGNTIFNGGRDGINYNGNRCEIAYNDVYKSNLIADDCATFYTVGGPQNTEIHHNWFHDSASRGSKRKAAGIYLDNDAEAFSVHHNVVWNVEWTGVQINWNGKNIDIFNNTLVKTKGGAMGAWHKAGTAFSNVKVWNNIADVKNVDDPTTQEDEGTFERDADKQNNIITKVGFTNYQGNNFTLTSSSPAVDTGRIISKITDNFKGKAPDAGAYELGAKNWVAGINWDPSSSPTGQGCYGLPGESCNETKELVVFVNPVKIIAPKKTYNFEVKYSAKTKREIVVEFWSATSWLGAGSVVVDAGSKTANVTVDLTAIPKVGKGYIYKTHIKPVGKTWKEAIDTDQVDNIEVKDQIFTDSVSFKDAPTTVFQANSYTLNVNYEASQDRELVLEFWSSNTWVAQKNVIVTQGKGIKTIVIDLPSLPAPGNNYVYKTHIRPLNSTWQQAIVRDQVNGVVVKALQSQVVSNGVYVIESVLNNQRLLSRVQESHSARMINPGNFDDQKWQFTHLSDDVYTIKNVGTNRYLEVPYAKCTDGANVATWTDSRDQHKQWKVIENGKGIYGLKPVHCPSKGLDRAAGALNANVQVWGYKTTNNNQKWKLKSLTSARRNSMKMTGIQVFPVPFKDVLTLRSQENLKGSKIRVLDINGSIILSKNITSDTQEKNIQLGHIQSGVYFIEIKTKNGVKVKQVIK